MSVYPVETTREEMKAESLRRMRLLGLDDDVISIFQETDTCYVSEAMGSNVFLLEADDSETLQIRNFEETYGCLVFHIITSHTPFGDMRAYLFVSPQASEWQTEQQHLADNGMVYAYVVSEIESGVSEIIAVPADGGLIRTA